MPKKSIRDIAIKLNQIDQQRRNEFGCVICEAGSGYYHTCGPWWAVYSYTHNGFGWGHVVLVPLGRFGAPPTYYEPYLVMKGLLGSTDS